MLLLTVILVLQQRTLVYIIYLDPAQRQSFTAAGFYSLHFDP